MLENLKIVSSIFGQTDTGEDVDRIVISNARGLSVSIIAYGGTLQSVRAPDKEREIDDVVLGYDSLEDYCRGTSYFGATIGRYANRRGIHFPYQTHTRYTHLRAEDLVERLG